MSETETGDLARFLAQQLHPEVVALTRGDGATASVIVAPAGFVLHDVKPLLDKYLPLPARRKGSAALTTLDAFLAHVARYRTDDTVLYATTEGAPALLAVYDAHPAGGDILKAAWGEHRARYAFPVSDEWQAWMRHDGHWLDQASFAAFVEDRMTDFVDPADIGKTASELVKALDGKVATPAEMLTLSRSLTIKVGATVKNAVNLATGEASLTYDEKHVGAGGGPVRVPNLALVEIPVFRDGTVYQLAVRVKYRVKDGGVSWSVTLHQPRKALDAAVKDALTRVRAETSLSVLEGAPEA